MNIRYLLVITVFLSFSLPLRLTYAQEERSRSSTEKEIEVSFKSDLLTPKQIKTLLDNATTMFGQGNKLEYLEEELKGFSVEPSKQSCGDLYKQMSILFVRTEMRSTADLLQSNALSQVQFAISRDGIKRSYLPLTKKNTISLRDNIGRTLKILKFVYSINDKYDLLPIYERTNAILHLALTTIDENIRIIESL